MNISIQATDLKVNVTNSSGESVYSYEVPAMNLNLSLKALIGGMIDLKQAVEFVMLTEQMDPESTVN